MKTIDTLIGDIYNVLDSGIENPNEEYVQQFATNLATILKDTVIGYSKERKGTLRMSNVGRPCKRQLWYESKGEKGEELDPKTKLKFMYGNIVEEVLLYLAKEAGHAVSHEQEEVEISGIVGHMDAVIDDVVIDVKSASSYAFKKFKENKLEDDDSFGYIPQLSGYAKALGKSQAAFLAMDKNTGELALTPIKQLADIEAIIDHTKSTVNSDVTPERGYPEVADGKSGNRKLHPICGYCAFKKSCYPDMRGFRYSNGIKYLTYVAKPPNVPEIDV